MNILYLSLGKEYGGTEKVVENLMNCFKSKNKLTIVALKNTRFFKVLYDNYNLESNVNIIGVSNNIFSNIIVIRKILKQNNFDIVHIHSILSNFIFQISNINLNNKSIVTVHSRSDFDRKKSFKSVIMDNMEIYLLKRNNNIIAVSNSIKNYLEQKNIGKKVNVIHNGIKGINLDINQSKIQEFKEKYYYKESFIVIFIGRLTEVKGIYNLIKIIKGTLHINKNIKFLVLGEGELKEYLEGEIFKYSLDNVKLLGFKKDIYEFLPFCDLLIMPSNMEGIPITILEAMSCKIPCIASNVGGIPEIIDGNNGILYENYDIQKAISKLNFLEKNREELLDIKNKCKSDFELKWSIDKFFKEYQNQYENTIRVRCD
ncbi:glycosyltransferase family 4 protein [Clostridium perfringens]|uniref:glycosyltransferase family 4 protein n=1 Tax=Clostridium perfringens TaxID=1502 RepID=UPI002863D6CE|nr:glycosyltransferase family 4 protein [Clostridium perfringens]ELC8365497.1 glycosyltransferase family 4 protein [Clostridium perfringens]